MYVAADWLFYKLIATVQNNADFLLYKLITVGKLSDWLVLSFEELYSLDIPKIKLSNSREHTTSFWIK